MTAFDKRSKRSKQPFFVQWGETFFRLIGEFSWKKKKTYNKNKMELIILEFLRRKKYTKAQDFENLVKL